MRSSARIPKEIPILLIGSDLDGRMFSEHTTTVLLSLHGAGLLSSHKLSPEQELILRWPEKNKETDIRVVGHIGEQSGRHTYGVAFFDQNLNFWEIDFPPVTEFEKQLGVISLVCGSCGALEKIDDTSVEADVCATNDSVLRTCKSCGTATLWKVASGSGAPTQRPANAAPLQPAPAAIPQSPASGQLPLFPVPATPPPPSAPAPPLHYDPAPPSPLVSPPAPAAPQPSFYAQSRDVSPSSPTSSSNFQASRPASSGLVGDSVADPPGASPGSVGARSGPVGDPGAAVLTVSPLSPEKSGSAPQPSPAARANRRKHPRIKVSYSACVRHPERGEEDVVTCEDLSKGGLRFKSSQKYYPQTLIDVAVPYSPGQQAIFVPAQIVFVEPLPEQSLFRYGVQYLTPTKPRDHF